jgi:hypothetical protein
MLPECFWNTLPEPEEGFGNLRKASRTCFQNVSGTCFWNLRKASGT